MRGKYVAPVQATAALSLCISHPDPVLSYTVVGSVLAVSARLFLYRHHPCDATVTQCISIGYTILMERAHPAGIFF